MTTFKHLNRCDVKAQTDSPPSVHVREIRISYLVLLLKGIALSNAHTFGTFTTVLPFRHQALLPIVPDAVTKCKLSMRWEENERWGGRERGRSRQSFLQKNAS